MSIDFNCIRNPLTGMFSIQSLNYPTIQVEENTLDKAVDGLQQKLARHMHNMGIIL